MLDDSDVSDTNSDDDRQPSVTCLLILSVYISLQGEVRIKCPNTIIAITV